MTFSDSMAEGLQNAPLTIESARSLSHISLWKAAVLLALVVWLYGSILLHLAAQWWSDSNFSHGFLVPPFVAYVLWLDRHNLARFPPASSAWGSSTIIISQLVLVAGVLGIELFLSRVSFILLLAGMVLLFRGGKFFRSILFAWACLFLMVPIPAILFNHVTFPLQILASKVAANGLPWLGVPVLREGNIIVLPSMSLEVAEACSGIRSLLSLLTLSVIYGYFTERRVWVRVVLALSAIPLAVAANALRVLGTGVLAQYWGPPAAEGFFHEFSGGMIFLVSVGGLIAVHFCFRVRRTKAKVLQYAG